MDKIYQIIIILIGIFIFCKVLNNVNTPIIKKINKYNPFATSMIFTYMEEPTNFNNEKKIQLLSKNNDVPIFFKLWRAGNRNIYCFGGQTAVYYNKIQFDALI